MAIVQLKDGSDVEIRPMQRQDVMGLYQVMSRVFQEGDSMLSTQIPFTAQQMDQEFAMAQPANQITYVALRSGRLVAWVRADRRQVPFMRHIATLWLGMDKEVRGLGLGEKLLEQVQGWAKDHQIEKIELGVRSSNRSAVRLYQKMGFVEEGRKVKAVKTENGYEDDIWMGLFLDETQKPKSATHSTLKRKSSNKSRSSKQPVRKHA